jgi:uncharacterized protein YndB with AHSA1/START domain
MSDEGLTGPKAGEEDRRWARMRRRLNCSPERAYRAWSDPEELARWFPQRIEGGLAVGSRTFLVWPDQRVWWDVIEATPNRRFAFRRAWGPDEGIVTTVTVSIDPAGYGTELTLEDGPFSPAAPGGLDAWSEALEGWGEALMLLRAHLDFSVDLRQRT